MSANSLQWVELARGLTKNTRWERRNRNFPGDAAGRHHLDQVTRADVSSNPWGPDHCGKKFTIWDSSSFPATKPKHETTPAKPKLGDSL